MVGLSSKSTTTWFLSGRSTHYFARFRFETVNTVQVGYAGINNTTRGFTWFINTFYIVQIATNGPLF
jgi:hypothetical protein